MVMLTLGTGVGGGVVFGGQLMRGLAEFGHIVVEHDGRPPFFRALRTGGGSVGTLPFVRPPR